MRQQTLGSGPDLNDAYGTPPNPQLIMKEPPEETLWRTPDGTLIYVSGLRGRHKDWRWVTTPDSVFRVTQEDWARTQQKLEMVTATARQSIMLQACWEGTLDNVAERKDISPLQLALQRINQ